MLHRNLGVVAWIKRAQVIWNASFPVVMATKTMPDAEVCVVVFWSSVSNDKTLA